MSHSYSCFLLLKFPLFPFQVLCSETEAKKKALLAIVLFAQIKFELKLKKRKMQQTVTSSGSAAAP